MAVGNWIAFTEKPATTLHRVQTLNEAASYTVTYEIIVNYLILYLGNIW